MLSLRTSFAAVVPAAFLLPWSAAQGPVGPALRGAPRASAAFAPSALGVQSIAQIGMIPDPSGAARRFVGALTVTGLPPGLGGAGGYDVVGFTYDRATETVTLDTRCAACNSPLDEFALNYAPDGSYAVFERLQTGLFQCAVGWDGVLTAPVAVSNGPLPGAIDPYPARIDGKPVLFFNAADRTVGWQAHDVAGALLTGAYTPVARPRGTGYCHSPTPIAGFDGDVEALLVCENVASGVSHWQWAGDLDPNTPPLPQQTTTNSWDNNGCLAGGRIYMVRSAGTQNAVMEYDVIAALGDAVPCSGDQVEVTVLGPIRPDNVPPDRSLVFASISFLPVPVVVPGIGGALGLDPTTFLHFGSVQHDPRTGAAVLPVVLPVPAAGQLAVQALTMQGVENDMVLSSTAAATLAGGPGVRSSELLTGTLGPENLEIITGEPCERTFLPTDHGAILQVRFAPPDDPVNPWVAGRDFAAVIRSDGTAFVDVRRLGALVIEVTAATDLPRKFLVKSKKLNFSGARVAAFKLAPPALLPQQLVQPFVVRQKVAATDNGYCVGLRAVFPNAPEFDTAEELRRLIVAEYDRRQQQRIDVMVCCHGKPGAFMLRWNIDAAGNDNSTYVAGGFANNVMRLNADADRLLDGDGINGIKRKVRTLVIFGCQVACPDNNNLGPAFLQTFTDRLDDNHNDTTTVKAWDVCSYSGSPFWGVAPVGGFWQWVLYPAWLGIAGGRQERTFTH